MQGLRRLIRDLLRAEQPVYVKNIYGNITGLAGANYYFLPGDRPILMVGGDHPYAQWGGNGMLACYTANNLRPYIAVNSASGSPAPGDTDTLSWSALAAIKGQTEICAHGARHIQSWERLNTGIRIQYSGVAASATVAIDGSGVTLTGNGGAENATLTFATYTTLSAMATQISAQGGGVWTATLASELLGTEASGNLLKVGARNVKASTNSQYFAAGGGIVVHYTGTAYESVWVVRTSNPSLEIYCDGVLLVNRTLSNTSDDTLSELVTNINAAGISGLTAYLMDNRRAETSSFLSYLQGDEDSQNIKIGQWECQHIRASLDAGLSRWYMIERQMQGVADVASGYGITMTHFAQSGDDFHQNLSDHQIFDSFRGNGDARAVSPYQVPSFLHDGRFSIMRTTADNSGTAWTKEQYKAVIDAMVDSGPYTVNLMCHKVLPDGSSGYTFTNPDSYYNMTEANFVPSIVYAGQAVAAGSIICDYPTNATRHRSRASRPLNYIFNPKWKNDGTSLSSANDAGFKIPGWYLVTNGGIFTSVAVSSGLMTVTTNASTSTPFLYSEVILEPGATYEVGLTLEISTLSAGNGVRLAMNAKRGRVRNAVNTAVTELGKRFAGTASNGARHQRMTMRFTMPRVSDYMAPKVVSNNAGTYNLGSNPADVKINIDSKLQLNVNCAGATPTATTSGEVAAAINAAIAASSSYPVEYQNCAKVVANKVVITGPYQTQEERSDAGYGISLDAGTTNSATSTIFGAAQCRSNGRWEAYADAAQFPWYFVVYAEMTGTFTIKDPFIRRLNAV